MPDRLLRRTLACALAALAAAAVVPVAAQSQASSTGSGQGWPNKPIRIVVPYGAGSSSSPLAVLAVLQGDVQFACVPAVAVLPQVKAGKLRPLAVSTAQRSQPRTAGDDPGHQAHRHLDGMTAPPDAGLRPAVTT